MSSISEEDGFDSELDEEVRTSRRLQLPLLTNCLFRLVYEDAGRRTSRPPPPPALIWYGHFCRALVPHRNVL